MELSGYIPWSDAARFTEAAGNQVERHWDEMDPAERGQILATAGLAYAVYCLVEVLNERSNAR